MHTYRHSTIRIIIIDNKIQDYDYGPHIHVQVCQQISNANKYLSFSFIRDKYKWGQ